MYLDRRADKVRAQPAWGQLQAQPRPFHRVVLADCPILLHAQNLPPRSSTIDNECRSRLLRRDRKPRVVVNNEAVPQPPVGGLDSADPSQLELLGQAVLQGQKYPLRPPTRLWRVGRNVLNAKLAQRAPNLRQHRLRHLAAGLGREEVVAAAIAVERAEQTMFLNHLTQTLETRGGALLVHQKGRIERA